MRAFLKQYGLAVVCSVFLACLAFVAYAHMRYTRAEHIYLSHLGTVTFRPHINVLTGIGRYEADASRWLGLQTIGTGALLVITIVMILLIWHRRTARIRQNELAPDAAAE